mgnify:FL=1
MIEARCGKQAMHTHKKKARVGQVYQWPECRQWHITSHPRRPKPGISIYDGLLGESA